MSWTIILAGSVNKKKEVKKRQEPYNMIKIKSRYGCIFNKHVPKKLIWGQ